MRKYLLGTSTLALLVALVPSSPALAEAPADYNDYQTVVSPTRSKGSAFDIDRSVTRVNRGDGEQKGAVDVPDALEAVPGVHLQRTNRGAGIPLLRGMIGPQNLTLLDGLRFDQSTFRTGPNQYLSLVDPAALSHMEVLLGPSSVLYGAGAMGGVVSLWTRGTPSRDGIWFQGTGRFQSADQAAEFSLHSGGRMGPFSGWAGGGFRHHGWLTVGGGDEVPNSGYDQGDWRARVAYELADGWTISSAYLGSRLRDANRTERIGRGDTRVYDNDDDFAYIDVVRNDPNDPLDNFRLALMVHRTHEVVNRRKCRTTGGVDMEACLADDERVIDQRTRTSDEVWTVGGLARAHFSLYEGRLNISAGSELYADMISSAGQKGDASTWLALVAEPRGSFSDESRYFTGGGFVYLDGRPYVSDDFEFVLSGGVRLDHVSAHAPNVTGIGDVDYNFLGPVGSFGMRMLFVQHYNLYVNYSGGFRAPNLQETTVLGDTGTNFEVPNPDLGPERSHTVEVGLKAHYKLWGFSAAFFHSWLTDVIDREAATYQGQSTIGGKPVVRRVNKDDGQYFGVEVGARLGPFEGFSFATDVAWMEGNIADAPARRIPPLQGGISARWQGVSDRLELELYARWAIGQDRLSDDDKADLRMCEDPSNRGTLLNPCPGSDAYIVPGLRTSWLASKDLRIFGTLDNFADVSYRTHGSGYDGPGINAIVGVSYDLK